MLYFLSALAGAAYGGLIGFLKYLVLWRKLLNAADDCKIKDTAVTGRMLISYAVNAAVLISVLLLRDVILPLDFFVTVVAVALALSVSGRFYPIHKIYSKVR